MRLKRVRQETRCLCVRLPCASAFSLLSVCSPARCCPFSFDYPAEHFSLVGDMRPKAIDDVHSWNDHRHGPVRGRKSQLFSKIADGPKDLLVLGLDAVAFLRLEGMMVGRFDNASLGMAMLHNTAETVYE
jgi:hypothetical protein